MPAPTRLWWFFFCELVGDEKNTGWKGEERERERKKKEESIPESHAEDGKQTNLLPLRNLQLHQQRNRQDNGIKVRDDAQCARRNDDPDLQSLAKTLVFLGVAQVILEPGCLDGSTGQQGHDLKRDGVEDEKADGGADGEVVGASVGAGDEATAEDED
jgi:hypothetical protein